MNELQTMIRVSVVDDDRSVRERLVSLLNESPGFACAGSHSTTESALELIPRERPHVVLMDIQIHSLGGVECVRRLSAAMPDLTLVMFTVHEDTEAIFNALAAGACGYLLKHTPSPQILDSIRQARQGGSPMTAHIARKVVQYFQRPAAPDPLSALSPREQTVLQQLAQGFLYKEIGASLGINADTVRKHLCSIYRKLQVRSRTEAVIKYLQTPRPQQF